MSNYRDLPNTVSELPEVPFVLSVKCHKCGKDVDVLVPSIPKSGSERIRSDCRAEGCVGYFDANREDSGSFSLKAHVQQGCFPGFVNIDTPCGHRRIDNITAGDSVWSWDIERSAVAERRVTRCIEYRPSRLIAILTDGESTPIVVTPRHSLLSTNGWALSGRLGVGDQLIQRCDHESTRVLEIQSVAKLPTKMPVYNLHTEVEHNFLVGGFVAHNFSWGREIRSAIHRVLFDRLAAVGTERLPAPGLLKSP